MTPRAICLAGPTASGKTAVALAFAAEQPLEIISVDSALVYRGMDIGTAKPTPAERAAVPHHLIDLLDPLQTYSAARFAADARRLIGEINARGRLALLVGGTMLYFKALRDGLDAMPAADAAVRADIDARAAAAGWPALHAELAAVDAATAARLAPNDSQRIQRALEVWHVSGRPLSAWHGAARAPDGGATGLRGHSPTVAPHCASPAAADGGDRGNGGNGRNGDDRGGDGDDGCVKDVGDTAGERNRHPPPGRGAPVTTPTEHLPLVALEPVSRAWLHDRIAARFDAMLAAGFIAEVQALRARGDLHAALPSVRCVGYRQAWAALDAGSLAALRDAGIAATRQLAKRQLTWLRSMAPRISVPCDAADGLQQALSALRTLQPHAG